MNLASRNKMAAPVLLPAGLIAFHAERLFLTVADRAHPVGGNSLGNQELLHGRRSPVTESQVVLRGAAFVAVPLDGHLGLRIVAQEIRGLGQGFARIGPQVGLIQVEVRIANFLSEEFCPIRGCRWRRWWWGCRY